MKIRRKRARRQFFLELVIVWTICVMLALVVGMTVESAAEDPISYNDDIRHILSNNCFKCHGPDDRARARRPRLDKPESSTIEARSGLIPIVPGRPDQSELIRRITSKDADSRMPPADEKLRLSNQQIKLLKLWIDHARFGAIRTCRQRSGVRGC